MGVASLDGCFPNPKEGTPKMDHSQSRIGEGESIDDHLWLRHASTTLAGNSTTLHSAVVTADFTVVEALIRNGAQIDAVDSDGNTPLILAAGSPRDDAWITVRTLLEAGAAVNHTNNKIETALIVAARQGDVHRLTQLLSREGVDRGARDQDGRDAVMHAVLAGHAPAVAYLLGQGAPWDSRDNAGDQAIDFAYANKDKACCRAFWERGIFLNHVNSRHASPESPLTLCLGWRDLKLMRLLVKAGTDPNIRHRAGLSAVHAAVARGGIAGLETLANLGADLNARDDMNTTPLEIALGRGHCHLIIRSLCAAGADPNLPMAHGGYPLVFSARRLRESVSQAETWRRVVLALISAGAEVNSTDANGNTALHYCGKLSSNKSALWGRLRRAGASTEIRNRRGRKPYLHFSRFSNSCLDTGAACCITIIGIPLGLVLIASGVGARVLDKAQIGNFWLQRKVERRYRVHNEGE